MWRRHPWLIAAVALLVVLLLWGRLRTPFGGDRQRYHNRVFTCVRVIDGDTIDINVPDGLWSTTRIRLWGVDAPEVSHDARPGMYYGPEAAAAAQGMVEGRSVRVLLAPAQSRDKYHRLLAYVYLDDGETMLNEALVTGGHAYADLRFEHPWRQRFETLEDKARKASAGLWGGVTLEQMPEWRQRREHKH